MIINSDDRKSFAPVRKTESERIIQKDAKGRALCRRRFYHVQQTRRLQGKYKSIKDHQLRINVVCHKHTTHILLNIHTGACSHLQLTQFFQEMCQRLSRYVSDNIDTMYIC